MGRSSRGIEDQGDVSIAEDGGSGEAGAALDVAAQRLDHDLLGVDDLVDHQAVAAMPGLDHDDAHRAGTVRAAFTGVLSGQLQHVVDPHDW